MELQAVVDEASKHIAGKTTQTIQAQLDHNTLYNPNDDAVDVLHESISESIDFRADLLHKTISESIDSTDIVSLLNVPIDPHEKKKYNYLSRQKWKEGAEDSRNFTKKMLELSVSGAACHTFVGVRPYKRGAPQSFLTRVSMEWWSENGSTYWWRKMFVPTKGSPIHLDGGGLGEDFVTELPKNSFYFRGQPHFPQSWQIELGNNYFIGVLLTYRVGYQLHPIYPEEQSHYHHHIYEDLFMQPLQGDAAYLEQCIWTMILTMPGIPAFFELPVECNEALIRNWFEGMKASCFAYFVQIKNESVNLEACCSLLDPMYPNSRISAAWRTIGDCYWEFLVAWVNGRNFLVKSRNNLIWSVATIRTPPWHDVHYRRHAFNSTCKTFEVNGRTMLVMQTYSRPAKTDLPWGILTKPLRNSEVKRWKVVKVSMPEADAFVPTNH